MTQDDLNEALAAEFDHPRIGEPEREQWRIETDRQAAWAARKLRTYLAEQDRIRTAAQEERDRIDAWEEDRLHGVNEEVEFFESHLTGYYRGKVAAEGPEFPKTYPVPGATMSRRKNPDRLEVTDEKAFVRWALDHGHHLYLRVAPDKSAIKQAITDDRLRLRPGPTLDKKGKPLPSEYGTEHAVVIYVTRGDAAVEVPEPLPGVVYVVGDERYGVEVTE